jgi:hypothetical protein
MSGVGGQTVLIVLSHDLVVVRLGHYKGAGPEGRALRSALSILMGAIPSTRGRNREALRTSHATDV